MTEGHTLTDTKKIARAILLGMGFSDDEIHEGYPVSFSLTENEMHDYARWDAQEKYNSRNIREIGQYDLRFRNRIDVIERIAYQNTLRKLQTTKTLIVDMAGISTEKKVAIDCGRTSPKIKTEILRREFDAIIKIPPADYRMLKYAKRGK